MAGGTPFTWDARARRYRDERGRFVTVRAVRAALDQTLERTGRKMRELAELLRADKITVDRWLVEMRATVKDIHLYSTAAARGGWSQMSKADFGRVGRELRNQYAYLDRFAADIEAGLTLGGGFIRRVLMYAESGRRTYYKAIDAELEERGFTQERSVLHPADHCDQCIAQAALGWQPLGRMIPIGERTCLSSCKCSKEYRNALTGEQLAA